VTGIQGNSGVAGTTGSQGPVGGFGNAVLFNTSTSLPSNINSTASSAIRQFRTVDTVFTGDIWWHVNTGRIWRATIDRIDTTTESSFTEITSGTNTSGTSGNGIIDLSGILNTSTSGERLEFSSSTITIYDTNDNLRVKLGQL
jgi:hypothetical protein